MRPSRDLAALKSRRHFLDVAAHGKKWVTPGVIVQAKPFPVEEKNTSGLGPSRRFGITASKKVGNAVKRNRAKRRLRALARDILTSRAAPAHDYVLVARAATVTRCSSDLRNDLISALKRLKLWREETP